MTPDADFQNNLIPVARPLLPKLEETTPFLRRIDKNQYYSNFGPLNRELELTLERHYRAPTGTIICCANATLGLTSALLNDKPMTKNTCLVPAWTFPATVHSIIAAGLKPIIVDCDEESGQMTLALADKAISTHGDKIYAVMPVSVFGAPINHAEWTQFQMKTGIKVVTDSAAAFDTVLHSEIISVVSLHATKMIAAGEGGFIICPSKKIAGNIRPILNFGYCGERVANQVALNGKLSEYGAAIGLASMKNLSETRRGYLKLAKFYSEEIKKIKNASTQPGIGETCISLE